MSFPETSITRGFGVFASLGLSVVLSGCNPPPNRTNAVPAAPPVVVSRPLHERAQETEKNAAGEIVGMSLLFDVVSDADLEQLADYPQLQTLRFQECPRVRGEGFAAVARLPELTTLSFMNVPIEDEFLDRLGDAPLLTDAEFQRTRLTGRTLADLPAGLERLDLGGRGIDPGAMHALSRFGNLRELGLHLLDRPLRDLPAFDQLAQLEKLDLTGTAVDDEGLARLVALKELRILRFEPKDVTDVGAATLANMVRLEELDLGTSQVTDIGFAKLQSLSELNLLWLPRGVSDAGLSYLTSMPKLQILELRQTRIDGTGLKNLEELKNLREVMLPNRRLSDEGKQALQQLRKSLPECYIAVAGGG